MISCLFVCLFFFFVFFFCFFFFLFFVFFFGGGGGGGDFFIQVTNFSVMFRQRLSQYYQGLKSPALGHSGSRL